jgi:hypothetical protein
LRGPREAVSREQDVSRAAASDRTETMDMVEHRVDPGLRSAELLDPEAVVADR